jgi:hypothetical protein
MAIARRHLALAGLAVVLLPLAEARYCLSAQEPKPAPAKVTVAGMAIAKVVDDPKTGSFVILEGEVKTIVKGATSKDVASVQKKVLDEHRKITADFTALTANFLQKKDFDGLKEAEKAFEARSQALLQSLGFATVEGTLQQINDELVLEGKLLPFRYDSEDKEIGKGKTLVEGTAVQVKGKDNQPRLAIHNGGQFILVSGKAAEQHANSKEQLRVYGVLRIGPTNTPVIEAERIEALKK